MDLRARYQEALRADGYSEDPHQLPVVDALQRLGDRLAQPAPGPLSRWLGPRRPPPRGLYLWGGVGRGKTWLMDLFFQAVPEPRKRRIHFHRFMQQVHERLRDLRQRDPLRRVAREMAREARLLCLDEFHVTDIGDAMILAGLLQALLEAGVVLVTTANVPPRELYRDGIQRAGFLPAIALLEERLEVVALGGGRDYRREVLRGAPVYHVPADAAAEAAMQAEFDRLAGGMPVSSDGELRVNGRAIAYRRRADGLAWFDFEALCGPPRSRQDYIALARTHHTLFLSDLPTMGAGRDDRTRRFIFLVDELYDRRVKLVVSAAAPPGRLYRGERLAFEFQRTASRLLEMQGEDYLGSPHRG
ncbi:MAG TPA: cell division protein ZapE [Gammaproteobacteria bacterium]|nr:cell division protein ZapE [Gammaproteobacteria bacterium]